MAGAVTALAVGAMLNVLGVAIGASTVDAVQRDTPGAATFTAGAGIWMAIAGAVGMLAGGMVASCLAATRTRTHAVLHGVGVWGVGFVLAIALVGTAISGGIFAAVRGASGAATTMAGAAVAGGAMAAGQLDVSALAERVQRRLAAPSDPAAASGEQIAAEMGDLIAGRLTDGEWTADNRQRMERLLAASTGLSPAEAQARLEQIEQDLTARARRAEAVARSAADAAATGAAVVAFWAFAAMLLGLGAAVGGASMAARHEERDTVVFHNTKAA